MARRDLTTCLLLRRTTQDPAVRMIESRSTRRHPVSLEVPAAIMIVRDTTESHPEDLTVGHEISMDTRCRPAQYHPCQVELRIAIEVLHPVLTVMA